MYMWIHVEEILKFEHFERIWKILKSSLKSRKFQDRSIIGIRVKFFSIITKFTD